MSLPARVDAAMDRLWDGAPQVGVAVSGGSDSMALLDLLRGWAAPRRVTLSVVTVDHGLRPDAAAEARTVAEHCRALGLPHALLRWSGWDGAGNLQDAARTARLRLIEQWRGRIAQVAFGHTADDQAETVLMRLARGSGVEGLAGIPDRRRHGHTGVEVIRPLLGERRDDLRDHLRGRGIAWVEDPTNADTRFDRVAIRQALATLAPLGIAAPGLAATAQRMARAREALEARAAEVAGRITLEAHLDVVFDRAQLAEVERDTQLRLLAAALMGVASNPYRPRGATLEARLDAALVGQGGTLHGCEITVSEDTVRVSRELAAVEGLRAPADGAARWDRRWSGALAGHPEAEIRALGAAGWAQLDDAPQDPPRRSLLAAPALWEGSRLLAAPLAGYGPEDGLRHHPAAGPFAPLKHTR